ncbi:hypothetical protein ACFL35_01750 [Candidatus Riflebacteria bacterium]
MQVEKPDPWNMLWNVPGRIQEIQEDKLSENTILTCFIIFLIYFQGFYTDILGSNFREYLRVLDLCCIVFCYYIFKKNHSTGFIEIFVALSPPIMIRTIFAGLFFIPLYLSVEGGINKNTIYYVLAYRAFFFCYLGYHLYYLHIPGKKRDDTELENQKK